MNKIVLITGGAKGIGKGIVEELYKEGYNIVLNYNKSEEQAKQLKQQFKNIEIYKADVTDEKQVQEMVNYCINKYGKIDVLINNAGISEIKLFTDITLQEWETMIKTNLTSVFLLSKEVVKYMINKKEGCIINISSIWGIVGGSCEVHYSASKAGIIGMTKALAKELGPSNIRVNSIAPGAIDTEMNKDITEEEWQEIKEETPLRKIGQPKDIAKCVKWLIEDEYTTGQVISPNGGWVIN